MFLVVSWSDVHFGFGVCILRARSGVQVKLRARKIGRVEVNLSMREVVTQWGCDTDIVLRDLRFPFEMKQLFKHHFYQFSTNISISLKVNTQF